MGAVAVGTRPDGIYVMYYSTPATIPLGCLAKTPPSGCVKTTNGDRPARCASRAPRAPIPPARSPMTRHPLSSARSHKEGPSIPACSSQPDGTPWLLWKSDGDCCNLPTTIYSQQLSADGLSVVGPAHRLIGATQSWEGNLVEGPSMIQNGNTFWLFYSANLWGTDNYGIGVARCATVVGPCTKPLDHAWLSSTASGGQATRAPGEQEFFQVGGLIWMVHHGLAPGQSGNDAQRRLYVDLLAFPGDQTPRLAPRPPAAALAEALLYFGDPNAPPQPDDAFLGLLHKVPSAFSARHDQVARGRRAARMRRPHPRAGRRRRHQFPDPPRTGSIRSELGRDLRHGVLLPTGRPAGTEGRAGGADARARLATVHSPWGSKRTADALRSGATSDGTCAARPPCRNFGGDPRSGLAARSWSGPAGSRRCTGNYWPTSPSSTGRGLAGRRRGLDGRLGHRALRRQHVDRPAMGAFSRESRVVAVPGGGVGVGRALLGLGGPFGGGGLAFE